MSNRKRIKPQNPVSGLLAALDGARIRGGCEHCDAYQTVHAHAHGADLHRITVCHDDDCPELAARQARQ